MNNLSIRYKLLFSFLFMAFLIALSTSYSLYNLNNIKHKFVYIIDNNVPRLEALFKMQNTSTEITALIHSFNRKNLTDIQIDDYKNALLASLATIDQNLKDYQANFIAGEKGSLDINEMQKIRSSIIIVALDTFSALAANTNANLMKEKMSELNQIHAQLNALITNAVTIESSQLEISKKSAIQITSKMYYFFLLTNGIILLVALIISFILIHIISQPIIDLKNFASQIDMNNLDKTITVNSKDEIGQLALSINSMLLQLAKTKSDLISVSREAGISEVATGILHNIGNVTNSINISASSIKKIVNENNGDDLKKITVLFKDNIDNLQLFLSSDKGKYIGPYLETVYEKFCISHRAMSKELDELILHLQHVMSVIDMQQSLNKSDGVLENLVIAELIDEAIDLHHKTINKNGIKIEKQYQNLPALSSIKAKIQQILINLIKNAIEALSENKHNDKKIMIQTWNADKEVYIAITDNGIGVEQDKLIKIFMFGFTTKPHGHGYGLHHSANLANELGGKLSVSSEGKHKGTTFTLHIPYDNR